VVQADPTMTAAIPKNRLPAITGDPSWDEEINAFADCILNDRPVQSGTSEDALRTMQLVF